MLIYLLKLNSVIHVPYDDRMHFICSGTTVGISPQLSAAAKAEETLGNSNIFSSAAHGSATCGTAAEPYVLPGGLRVDPAADFTLIYAFLGSLFDSSRTDLDHWQILAQVCRLPFQHLDNARIP